MSFWGRLRYRLRALATGSRDDRASREEFAFHLEMEAEKLRRSGLSAAEARRRAALAFGSREDAREEVRDARGSTWVAETVRDLGYSARQLRKSPGFTLAAVLTLTLGIGATTAIFSVVDGVLLRPAPVAGVDRLVAVWETDRRTGTTREPSSWPDFVDLARTARTLDGVAAIVGLELNFGPERGDPTRIAGVATTDGYFSLIGIAPLLGRTYSADEAHPGGRQVVVLGESFWRGRLDGDPNVVGRTVRLNDSAYTVVGVVPRGADFGLDQLHARAAYHAPYTGVGEVDVWLPLQASESQFSRDTHPFLVIGRLARSVTVADASRQVTTVAADLEATFPRSNVARGMWVEPLSDVVFGRVRPLLILLMAAVTLVLIVACVNVANLLLARGTSRAREVAVRTALGAGSGRLARQFLAENLVLALVGGISGVGLAVLGLRALLALAPPDIPRVAEVGIDGRVLLVALSLTLVVAVVFGMVPTIQSLRAGRTLAVSGGSRTMTAGPAQGRFRRGLIVAELALSVTLVVSAGLLVRSFWSIAGVDPGFQAAGVVKAEYQLPTARYPRDFSRWPRLTEIHSFNANLLARVKAVPGVEAAAIAGTHPLDPGFTNSFQVVGREAEAADWPEISVRLVSPEYFATMGVRLIAGRALEPGDRTDGAMVAVINQAAARQFFASREPLGAEIRFWGTNRRIVGVVGDERFHGVTEPAPIAVYAPLSQAPSNSGVLLVRASGDPIALAGPITTAIHAIDPALAVSGIERLADTIRGSVAQQRFAMVVLLCFAGVTLALALIGIHGVLSYATAQRTRELGVRAALGASQGRIAALVVRGGLVMATVGVGIGLVGAALGSKLLASLLYGVSRLDPLTFVAVPVLMLGSALAATWLPARRASRIAPIEVLRGE